MSAGRTGASPPAYASEDGDRGSIALATSADGLSWDRRGTTLVPTAEDPEGRSLDTLRRQAA